MSQTWFCTKCGSFDIRHDGIVQWDPQHETWEVIAVLDDAYCAECQERDLNDPGAPTFGVPHA